MTLLASLSCANERHVIVGGLAPVAAIRAKAILAAGAFPILIEQAPSDELSKTLQGLIEEGKVTHVNEEYTKNHLVSVGREEVDNVVDKVFVTLSQSQQSLKEQISADCKRLRIPVNVSDSSELCTFTLLSTHSAGDFQFGVTTSGKGCKLASRIKRELVGALPSNIAQICDRVGELRKQIQEDDALEEVGGHDDDAINTSKLNSLVKEFNMTRSQQATQRSRWLSQIVEYYPLSKLADVSLEDLKEQYRQDKEESIQRKKQKLEKKGSLSLVGSGPGSVSMLTLGALQEIHSADLVLADKLVPQQVLDLIPKKSTKLFIARKFPGNAERAQQELLEIGLDALQKGEKVVRLKQGDPYIFGRGGEEFNFFTSHGFPPVVLPGITSALAAPVYSNIPATHREVADQVLICTGTGRRGALPNLPEFVESRTTVFLMALHRIVQLIPHLIDEKGWRPDLPVAIVERASCPDQRVIRTTLEKAAAAVEALGSRPPGLFIAGNACHVLQKKGNEDWVVEEGTQEPKLSGFLQQLSHPVEGERIGVPETITTDLKVPVAAK
ncbi:hypothetical protein FT662_01335 [Candidozyma haemuli var. vulneris]|uniref:uroporphyrinogen-III C-methyltransferase n=1 Tax=Candidozyma haemuli TaxID=45357 RepID=A0A2V1AXB3_9ASCO|nr:uroporphyrinogen-III C-methyltransferase [[Candida] haemuloni]KAF3992165.1 hypothetical protein FT662_01335 [[Candida] haemuloni var. vulneris]PVH22409.1 uroporphyrinogen-III C-methyltransferase [[Candida] haemuloni]